MTDHITLPRSVVEQAIEALEDAQWIQEHHQDEEKRCDAIEALRAALAGAAQAEPFGYVSEHNCAPPYQFQFNKTRAGVYTDNCTSITPVYTAPQPAQPVAVLEPWQRHAQHLTRWLHCMSYNDSYFGEPAGLVKQVTAELNRLMPATPLIAAAPTPPAATVLEPLTLAEIKKIVQEASKDSALRRDGTTSERIVRAVEAAHAAKLAKLNGIRATIKK